MTSYDATPARAPGPVEQGSPALPPALESCIQSLTDQGMSGALAAVLGNMFAQAGRMVRRTRDDLEGTRAAVVRAT